MTHATNPVWESWRSEWDLRPDTIYLNHGSFGPAPRVVLAEQQGWKQRLDRQPMDFFFRKFAPAWREARRQLAEFVGCSPGNLVFLENATQAMNVVAAGFPLSAGDEVVLTDHEYGAVERIWRRRTEQAGAQLRIARLPQPLHSTADVEQAVVAEFSSRTRLLVVSHITSATAIILPVQRLCAAARRHGVATCIDGPHAPAQIPLSLDEIGGDFYVASCHKWLSAPFGSGFLFAAPPWHATTPPTQLSWGVLPPARPQAWDEEYIWSGTRDPSAYLAVPAAIQFLKRVGADPFRERTHELARYARRQLLEFAPREPLVPDQPEWYGAMTQMPLPTVDARGLQHALWERCGMEVPIVEWSGQVWIRVSCHLYNRHEEIDMLTRALRELLPRFRSTSK